MALLLSPLPSCLTFLFSAGLFLKSSPSHAYCAQRMERHVFVLDGSTASKKWVKELSVHRSGDLHQVLFIKTFLKATQRSLFNWNMEHFLKQNGPHPVFTSARRGFNSMAPRKRGGGEDWVIERCEALCLYSSLSERMKRGQLCIEDEKDATAGAQFLKECVLWHVYAHVSVCSAACMYVGSWAPSRLCSLCRSDESDQASCASTGPGPLIKNANISRRVFDARPRHTKPAEVTKAPCNPLFGARHREAPSWEPWQSQSIMSGTRHTGLLTPCNTLCLN